MGTAVSIYDDTVDLLKLLDANQLVAIHSIIVELAQKNDVWVSPLGIETEDQLWGHIDHSLAQAKAGIGREADEVITDMLREYAG